jgi:hypothetical protein
MRIELTAEIEDLYLLVQEYFKVNRQKLYQTDPFVQP